MDLIINIAVFLIAAVIFTFVGMFLRKKTAEAKLKGAENGSTKNYRNGKQGSRK